MKIISEYKDLIGQTPLFHVKKLEKALGLDFTLLVKLEMFNPAHSIKDRPAFNMINEAMLRGDIDHNSTIIEPTSGNMGIGIAAYAASLGIRTIICMPDSMSKERQDLMKAYGAELVLTPGAQGMKGAIEKAQELAQEIKGSFIPSQFENFDNAQAHYNTTAPEIWEATDGNVDYLISGVGTGGTITGISHYFKERNPKFKAVAVEPDSSQVLAGKQSGKHGIQGIGAGFVPKVLDTGCYDIIVPVTTEASKDMARAILHLEGLLVGISSGAAIAAAIELSKKERISGKTVVAILPDTGERYLSTGMFS